MYLDTVSTKALGSDIEYPLRSNALSAKSILGGRVALTILGKSISDMPLASPGSWYIGAVVNQNSTETMVISGMSGKTTHQDTKLQAHELDGQQGEGLEGNYL